MMFPSRAGLVIWPTASPSRFLVDPTHARATPTNRFSSSNWNGNGLDPHYGIILALRATISSGRKTTTHRMKSPLHWGTSYYPEHHTPEEWARDLDNMQSLGLTGVRILDFAWTAIEPREACYEFEWLDRFLAMLQDRGMWSILCTPTATPPAWLARQYPEIMIVERRGRTRVFGNRREGDVDSPIYRHYAAELARTMGERYGHHPTVRGWQIDNELVGSEIMPPECHSKASNFGFRQYLKRRHGTIETLNERWGMRFWNQEFSDWGEVDTPHHERPCAGHYLDYCRYFSESQRDFIQVQADALREVVDPAQFVSHNSTAVFDRGLDHLVYAEAQDVVGWDAYPGAASGMVGAYKEAFTALACDLFRTAKRRSYWIFETDSFGPRNCFSHFAELAARGAAGIVHWHWWTHHAHVEQGSDTICDFAGRPKPGKVERLKALYQRPEFKHLGDDELPRQKAAFIFSPDCVRLQSKPSPYHDKPDLSYLRSVGSMAEAVRRRGIAVDVVRPGDLLEKYDLLVMPSLSLLTGAHAEAIVKFVRDGGVLLASGPTAFFDEWGVYYRELGSPLKEVLGFTQSELARPAGEPAITWNDGREFATDGRLSNVGEIDGEVLATVKDGEVKDCVAAYGRAHGKGRVFYLCASSDEGAYEMAGLAGEAAGLVVHDNPHRDVGIFPDLRGEGTWFFNHSKEDRTLEGVTMEAGQFRLVRQSNTHK